MAHRNASRFKVHDVADCNARAIYTLTLPKRYSNVRLISRGSQGIVVSADDATTRRRVAIKMMRPFNLLNKDDARLSALRAIREFSLLLTVKHPNIVQTKSVFTPQEDVATFEEVYLVMELMEDTLRSGFPTIPRSHASLSFIIYQILCGVNHLHREDIIHRDLKPTNIGINPAKNYATKVLDFGFARDFTETTAKMSGYVVTRNYRAPEIVLMQKYSKIGTKADVWSIGCIFAEMITGQILFPGDHRLTQWREIVRKMGTPSESFISQLKPTIESDTMMFNAVSVVRDNPTSTARPIEQIIPDHYFDGYEENPRMNRTATDARRLLAKMLIIDPRERYTIPSLLRDPYIKRYSKMDEVNAPLSCEKYDTQLDEENLSLEELKARIFEEVKSKEQTFNVFGGL